MKDIVLIVSSVLFFICLIYSVPNFIEISVNIVFAPSRTIPSMPGSQPSISLPALDSNASNITIDRSIGEFTAEPIPFLQPPINAKSLIINYTMNDTALTVKEVTVVYGLARTYIADPDQFRIFLKDFKGQDLFVFRTYRSFGD